jgi:Zn-dependent protease with chaperone function
VLNFFEQQAQARRRTSLLVAVYVLGVMLFVVVVTPVLMGFGLIAGTVAWSAGRENHVEQSDQWSDLTMMFFTSPLATLGRPEGQVLWALAGGGTLLLVIGASAWKASSLRRGGGRMVAESLGARLVVGGSGDFYDQRLLNVVEEMAIASGSPVPPVYVLDKEDGINAFAAGYSSSDAVIAVTRGAARSLTREQLQGVVAHEFSHMFNGDMRLNIRLIGLLYGIIAVQLLGRLFFNFAGLGRGGGRDSGRAAILFLVVGLLLLALGLTGAVVARVVKAMIGREREYLADASAAQFTRNPCGLAAALRVVGGDDRRGVLDSSGAQEYSHLYFVQGVSGWFSGLTDSHPPLPRRIRRLDPSWDGTWLTPIADEREVEEHGVGGASSIRTMGAIPLVASALKPPASGERSVSVKDATTHAAGLTPEQVFARVASARKMLETLPTALVAAARDPHDARALLLAMLLDSRDETRAGQIGMIAERLDQPTAAAAKLLDGELRTVGPGARLPLLELSLSAMASLSPDQYTRFRAAIEAEISAAGRSGLFQTCVQRMLMVHLDRRFGKASPPRVQYYALTRLGEECSVLLSTAATVAGQDPSKAAASVADECAPARGALDAGDDISAAASEDRPRVRGDHRRGRAGNPGRGGAAPGRGGWAGSAGGAARGRLIALFLIFREHRALVKRARACREIARNAGRTQLFFSEFFSAAAFSALCCPLSRGPLGVCCATMIHLVFQTRAPHLRRLVAHLIFFRIICGMLRAPVGTVCRRFRVFL